MNPRVELRRQLGRWHVGLLFGPHVRYFHSRWATWSEAMRAANHAADELRSKQ